MDEHSNGTRDDIYRVLSESLKWSGIEGKLRDKIRRLDISRAILTTITITIIITTTTNNNNNMYYQG